MVVERNDATEPDPRGLACLGECQRVQGADDHLVLDALELVPRDDLYPWAVESFRHHLVYFVRRTTNEIY